MHTCSRQDSINQKPWCATTPNYDIDGKWGFCATLNSQDPTKQQRSQCSEVCQRNCAPPCPLVCCHRNQTSNQMNPGYLVPTQVPAITGTSQLYQQELPQQIAQQNNMQKNKQQFNAAQQIATSAFVHPSNQQQPSELYFKCPSACLAQCASWCPPSCCSYQQPQPQQQFNNGQYFKKRSYAPKKQKGVAVKSAGNHTAKNARKHSTKRNRVVPKHHMVRASSNIPTAVTQYYNGPYKRTLEEATHADGRSEKRRLAKRNIVSLKDQDIDAKTLSGEIIKRTWSEALKRQNWRRKKEAFEELDVTNDS